MYVRLLVIVVIIIALYMLARWFIRTPPEQVRKQGKKVALYLIVALLVIMAVTGKLHWLFGLLAGLLPFAQRLMGLLRGYQMFKRMSGQFKKPTHAHTGQASQQQSTISSAFLRMTLDHESGELSGEVIQGRYQGQQLNDMALAALLSLLSECQTQDDDSTTLLETYLDRRFGDNWREHASGSSHQQDQARKNSSAEITLDEAYEILGVAPNSSADEVKKAHKRLIQKVHPDRGGSEYLAAKINKAKDIIMAHLKSAHK